MCWRTIDRQAGAVLPLETPDLRVTFRYSRERAAGAVRAAGEGRRGPPGRAELRAKRRDQRDASPWACRAGALAGQNRGGERTIVASERGGARSAALAQFQQWLKPMETTALRLARAFPSTRPAALAVPTNQSNVAE